MCDPVTMASFGLSTMGAIESAKAQNEAYRENAIAANRAKMDEDRLINLKEAQEDEATATQKIEQDRQTQELEARAEVAAAESGGFLNNDAVIQDIVRQGLEANSMTTQNLERTKAQYNEERLGATSRAQSRINSVSRASPLATGLQIASSGVDAYSSYKASKKPK